MTVTVYTKPACVQCNATYRALDKKGITYQSVDISQDAEALERLKALGYMQAPVVVTDRTTGPVSARTRSKNWRRLPPSP